MVYQRATLSLKRAIGNFTDNKEDEEWLSCPGFLFLLYAVFYVLKLFSLYLPDASLPGVCVQGLQWRQNGAQVPSCSHKARCKPSPTAGLQWVGAEQDIVVAPVEGVRPTLWDLSESCKQGPCVCSEEVKTCLLYSPRAFPPGVIVIIPLITDFWQHSLLVHLFTPVLGLHAKKADFPPEITLSPATAEETLCSTNRHVFIAKKHLSVGRLAVYYTSNLLQIMCACFMSIYGARCH